MIVRKMKSLYKILLLSIIVYSCKERAFVDTINAVNWEQRSLDFELADSLKTGSTYLSVYSQIYSMTEHRTHDLTVTVSLRNTDQSDTIYINKAEYFDTRGNSIKNYFDAPIFIAPMETVEIVIEESDRKGGTGANFLFDWAIQTNTCEPLFDAVMISTSGQQGLSITTQGKKVR